jgi:hypothetical protein
MHEDLAAAKEMIQAAQERQAEYANAKRQDMEFKTGDQVLLSTANLRLRTDGPASKFNSKWTGPFTITERIGKVAYRLELPDTMRVHPVFHVSLLKPYQQPDDTERPAPPPPPIIDENIYEAERISNRRTIKVNGKMQTQYLVHWKGYPDSDSTWEPASHLLGKTCKAWRKAIDTAMAETGQTAIQAADSPAAPAAPPPPAAADQRQRRRSPRTATERAPSSAAAPADLARPDTTPQRPTATRTTASRPTTRYSLRPRRNR